MTSPVAGAQALVRLATPSDLPRVGEIFAITQDADSRPPAGSVPSLYPHELAAQELVVTECEGWIVGFAALLARGPTGFLADLFVDPACQSGGVGSRLLRRVLPSDARLCFTLASSDPRALSLYTRAGMRPHTPFLQLRGRPTALDAPTNDEPEVVEAEAGDPDLVEWDRAIGGRERPRDHVYWVQHRGGVPFWFMRGGARVGYGYAQTYSDDLPSPAEIITIGPLGVRDAANAAGCVMAALRWARRRGASAVRITVPGPHPALARLLALGLLIHDTYYYCSTRPPRLGNLRCYIPSGGDLF